MKCSVTEYGNDSIKQTYVCFSLKTLHNYTKHLHNSHITKQFDAIFQ